MRLGSGRHRRADLRPDSFRRTPDACGVDGAIQVRSDERQSLQLTRNLPPLADFPLDGQALGEELSSRSEFALYASERSQIEQRIGDPSAIAEFTRDPQSLSCNALEVATSPCSCAKLAKLSRDLARPDRLPSFRLMAKLSSWRDLATKVTRLTGDTAEVA